MSANQAEENAIKNLIDAAKDFLNWQRGKGMTTDWIDCDKRLAKALREIERIRKQP